MATVRGNGNASGPPRGPTSLAASRHNDYHGHTPLAGIRNLIDKLITVAQQDHKAVARSIRADL
ncbi:hypothetical protein QBC43DRAFT_294857 [Cladorrhinum sp. PSN259]|nr:hypothetical protein QBC43DRAFT_294857 [Cladorrhinum sp. PSN259]